VSKRKVLTPRVAAKRMREAAKGRNSHEDGDDLLCEIGRTAGFPGAVREYERIEKWFE